MIVGTVIAEWGIWDLADGRNRLLGIGFFLVGLGTVALGGTNGFTSHTDTGSKAGKVGIVAFILGLPILLYAISTIKH